MPRNFRKFQPPDCLGGMPDPQTVAPLGVIDE